MGALDSSGSIGVAIVSGSSISVYRATDSLTYVSVASYSIGGDLNSAAMADFNGDGKADIAVSYDATPYGGNHGIAILLNKGDGTFASPVTYASSVFTSHFAVLDLNHDGFPDIAAIITTGATVLLGKGDGTFGSPTQYAFTGGSGQAIAIADFNSDGNPDLAVGGTAGILLGNGDGTFRTGKPLSIGSATNNFWTFAAGDLNGDGKPDLVCSDIMNQLVQPLWGNGDGTFTSGQAYALSALPDSLILTDFNHDGRLDIVNGAGDARMFGPSDSSGNTDILLNNGDGTFQGAPTYQPQPTFSFVHQVGVVTEGFMAAANFGGKTAGVITVGPIGSVLYYPGDGKGGLLTPQPFPINGQAAQMTAGDFNGDGLPDVALIDSASTTAITLLLANSSGFAPPATVVSGTNAPMALISGDFDGDGKLDLVVLSSSDATGGATTPGTLAFAKGNGDGTFHSPVTSLAGLSPLFAAAVDVNGDGKLDVVFSDSGTYGYGGGVYVALNTGGGAFQAPVEVFSGSYPAFALADVNGDRVLDLVASDGSNLEWLAG